MPCNLITRKVIRRKKNTNMVYITKNYQRDRRTYDKSIFKKATR